MQTSPYPDRDSGIFTTALGQNCADPRCGGALIDPSVYMHGKFWHAHCALASAREFFALARALHAEGLAVLLSAETRAHYAPAALYSGVAPDPTSTGETPSE